MNVKTLLDTLRAHVSCSVCKSIFTEPKLLPCLHRFCLHCLNGIHRTSPSRRVISCPECRKQIEIPGSGNPSELQTDFQMNGLLDMLAIKECSTTGLKCGKCDKRSDDCSYCFQCCAFWCEDCISAHNIIPVNRDHRVLEITNFQDPDIEEVLKRPAFCQKKHHEKDELKFFCKVCKAAICITCALTDHEGHTKMPLEAAANERSMLNTEETVGAINTGCSATKAQQPCTNGKENSKSIAGFEEKHVRGSAVKVEVHTRQFRHVLYFGEEGESVGMLREPCGVAVNDRNEIAVTEFTNHRVSVFSSDGTHLRSFGRKGVSEGEFQCPTGIGFGNNGNIIVADYYNNRLQMFTRNGEFVTKFGDRGCHDHQLEYPVGLSVTTTGDIIVADNGQFIKLFSPLGQFVRKFGGQGSLEYPYHCIQTEQYLIVSERGDHCIKVFDWEGIFLFKFGKKGDKEAEFSCPSYLSVNKDGHLMVCDSENNRVQVFEINGKFVTKFGRAGSGRGEFSWPESTANLSDGRMVVCDKDNNRMQIFEFA